MSYYSTLPAPFTAPIGCSVMRGQLFLQQERAYLLSALAAEESRGEQLTLSLEATRKRLAAAEHADSSTDEVKILKKQRTGLAGRLKRSQKSQKAMVNNLAAVTSRMQMLEQHQWRRAHFEYAQRAQLTQLNDINRNMQNLTLVSQITPSYQYQAQSPISSQTPGFVHPVPVAPMPNIQWATNYGDWWGSPLYAPFYGQVYERPRAANQGQVQTVLYNSPNEEAVLHDVEYSGLPGRSPTSRHLRTMSLPMVQHSANWVGKGTRRNSAKD